MSQGKTAVFLFSFSLFLYYPWLIKGNIELDIKPCERCDKGTPRICCANRSLTTEMIPSSLANVSGVTHLYMSVNRLKHLDNKTFPEYANLVLLDVSTNEIEWISDDFFSGMKLVEEIYIQNNKLTTLPTNLLVPLQSLKKIHFYNNVISSLGETFYDPIKTSVIEIFTFNNILKKLMKQQMSHLKKVERLYLFNNIISEMEDRTFEGLNENIRVLQIFGNDIGTIKGYWLEGMGGRDIQLLVNKWNAPRFQLDHRLVETANHTSVICQSNCTHQSNCTCQLCGVGTYGFENKPGCVPCPAGGFYQDVIGQWKIISNGTGCKKCNHGTYIHPYNKPGVGPLECKVCPIGTQTDRNAEFRGCYCLINNFRMGRFRKCRPCPKYGVTCVNEYIEPRFGFWWSWKVLGTDDDAYGHFADNIDIQNDDYKLSTINYNGTLPLVHPCPNMKNCLGGPRGSCREGHTGPLCAVCLPGYYKSILSCSKCPSKLVAIIQMVVVAILLIILILIIMKDRKKSLGKNRTVADILLARLKIVIGFYQVTAGVFDAFSYVKWPDGISEFSGYAKFLQLNVLQIASFNCLEPSLFMDAYSDFSLAIVVNISVCIIAVLYYLFKKIIVMRAYRNHPGKLARSLSETKMICYRNMFLFLFVSYPSTCAKIIQLLPGGCKKVCLDTGKTWCPHFLRADYSLECYKGNHQSFVILAHIMLVYPIGFPLLLAYFAFKVHSDQPVIQALAEWAVLEKL